VKRNLFEYRKKPTLFFDGWETGQDWKVHGPAGVDRVTTDPFAGAYCVRLTDGDESKSCGLYKDELWGEAPLITIEVAQKVEPPTPPWSVMGQIYVYNKDHTRIALIVGQQTNGDIIHWGAGGTIVFYHGSMNTWYKFKIRVNWKDEKFDVWLYDRLGNLLAEAHDIPFLNSTTIEVIAHLLLYSPIVSRGTMYWDAVEVDP